MLFYQASRKIHQLRGVACSGQLRGARPIVDAEGRVEATPQPQWIPIPAGHPQPELDPAARYRQIRLGSDRRDPGASNGFREILRRGLDLAALVVEVH